MIRLAVRPEELNPGRFEGENNLSGMIDSRSPISAPMVRVQVDMEGHPVLLDMFNERKLKVPAVGQQFS